MVRVSRPGKSKRPSLTLALAHYEKQAVVPLVFILLRNLFLLLTRSIPSALHLEAAVAVARDEEDR
jgi:hypothetical protein